VSADNKRAHLKFTGDGALFPAAAAAVQHFAEDAKLPESDRTALIAACEQVFGDALRRAETPETALEVTIERFPDRLEIAIAHAGLSGPAVGLDSFLGAAAGPAEAASVALLSRVDRVKYETAGQLSRMILVKYLPGAKSRAN